METVSQAACTLIHVSYQEMHICQTFDTLLNYDSMENNFIIIEVYT